MKKLMSPYKGIRLELKNRVVMAPMTRSRAHGNIPNALMAEYYAQRKGPGLIITEGTAPAPEALGYPRMPGVFSEQQILGWKPVTEAVHGNGTKIFLQLMHTGRIGHVSNLPENVALVGATALRANGQIHTATGSQDYSEPEALTTHGVKEVIKSYVQAARNAMKAGFDGVEIHGANGYLVEQFLNPNVNDRTDEYGGSMENRVRFATEVVEQVAQAIGKENVGIRLSPHSKLGDLQPYDSILDTYTYLAGELNSIGIAYIHISMNAEILPGTVSAIRDEFEGTLICTGNFTPETAEAELQRRDGADLIAFGRSFLANPDFVERIVAGHPFNAVDFSTVYTLDGKGYTDYPTMSGVNK